MPKTVTIKAPLNGGGTAEISGNIVYLYVGPYQEKFLIQKEPSGATFLTHYASGQKCGPGLAATRARLVAQTGNATDRDAAKQRIADLIRQYGAERVLERLRGAPVLNP